MPAEDESTLIAALHKAHGEARGADYDAAVKILEHVLGDASPTCTSPALRRVVVRLASLYRLLVRYGDEVALLEGYLEEQPDDPRRGSMIARLGKARTLLDESVSDSLLALDGMPGPSRRKAAG